MNRVRNGAVRREAIRAGWPVPVWPPAGCSAEDAREWTRLYKRLRWALRTQVDLTSNVRPGAKLARLRLAARQRGLGVDLTLQDYKGLLRSGRCHYCDAALPATGHGVDRKESSVGYTLENVVLACDACNRIKADLFTYDQMLEIGSLLRRWRAEGRWKDPQRKDGRRFGGRPLKGDIRREIEEWNERWAEAASGPPGSARPGGGGGSGLVREGHAPYALQCLRSELPDELNDLQASGMRGLVRPIGRSKTDRTLRDIRTA